MAKYTVNLSQDVDFAPSDEAREILQNVRMILNTRKGSVPLDRDFGLTWEHVDKPMQVAQMLMRSEIIDAVERYERRAIVDSVNFDNTAGDKMDGILKPHVIVEIKTNGEV